MTKRQSKILDVALVMALIFIWLAIFLLATWNPIGIVTKIVVTVADQIWIISTWAAGISVDEGSRNAVENYLSLVKREI